MTCTLPTRDQSISLGTWWNVLTYEHTTSNKIHRFLWERAIMDYLSYCVNQACYCPSTVKAHNTVLWELCCLSLKWATSGSDRYSRYTRLWNAGLSRARSFALERAGFLWTSHITCGKELLAVELWASARNGGMGCTSVCLGPLNMVFNCWVGSVCQAAAEAARFCAGNKPPNTLWLGCLREWSSEEL